jgi:hypothetical protein
METTIEEATLKRFFYDTDQQLKAHLATLTDVQKCWAGKVIDQPAAAKH